MLQRLSLRPGKRRGQQVGSLGDAPGGRFGIPGVDTPLDAEQQAAAAEAALEMGVPAQATIFVGKHTIGANGLAFTEGGKAADGKGIDYFFAAHGDSIVAAYFAGLGSGGE